MNGYNMYWTSNTVYIDIETGEIINKYKIDKQDYIIIKKESKTIYNEYKTKRHTTNTIKCRRNPQRRINFDT